MKKLESSILSISLCLFWCLLALGQLGRIQIAPSMAIYIHDLLLLSLLVWYGKRFSLSHLLSQAKKKVQLNPAAAALGVLILLSGSVATILTGEIVQWFYLARLMFYATVTVLLVQRTPRGSVLGHSFSLMSGYLAAGLGVLYFGFLQYILLPDTRFLYVLGWDDHYFRLISTQLDPAFAGALLIITFFLLERVKQDWARVVLRSLVVVAIALTFSRATYLGFGVGILGFVALEWWRQRNRWQLLAFLPLLLVCIWLTPKPTGEGVNLTRTSTIEARSTATHSLFVDIKPWEWIIGRGLFVPLPTSTEPSEKDALYDHANVPDNVGALLVTGLGVGGSILLLVALWQARTVVVALPSWLQATLGALLVHSSFNNTIFQPFVWLFVCGLIAISLKEKATA